MPRVHKHLVPYRPIVAYGNPLIGPPIAAVSDRKTPHETVLWFLSFQPHFYFLSVWLSFPLEERQIFSDLFVSSPSFFSRSWHCASKRDNYFNRWHRFCIEIPTLQHFLRCIY